jgi:hypothetical protein
VQRAGNRIPNFRETQNYVKTVMQLYGMLKPPVLSAAPAGAEGQVPRRVRMELPGPSPAQARRNMPAEFAAPALTEAAMAPGGDVFTHD